MGQEEDNDIWTGYKKEFCAFGKCASGIMLADTVFFGREIGTCFFLVGGMAPPIGHQDPEQVVRTARPNNTLFCLDYPVSLAHGCNNAAIVRDNKENEGASECAKSNLKENPSWGLCGATDWRRGRDGQTCNSGPTAGNRPSGVGARYSLCRSHLVILLRCPSGKAGNKLTFSKGRPGTPKDWLVTKPAGHHGSPDPRTLGQARRRVAARRLPVSPHCGMAHAE